MGKTYSIVEQHRGKIYDFHYNDAGKKYLNIVDFKPTLGLKCEDPFSYWKDLYDNPIEEIGFNSIYDWWQYSREYQHSKDIYGNIPPVYQYISEEYKEYDNYNTNLLKIAHIDIEVYSEEGFPYPEIAAWPITSITIKDVSTQRFYVASTKKYNKVKTELKIDPRFINFKHLKDDKEILLWLVKVLKHINPDILCGWYSDNFDFPYIINRFDFLFDDEDDKNELSPKTGKVSSELMKNQRDFRNIIGGITLFDYMKLYKKYIFEPRESYSLNSIANIELGEAKLDYSEHENLGELWKKDPQKYVDYNIKDVELIDLIDKKLGLIDLAATIAYKAKCNLIDVMGTIRIWDVYFYNYLKKEKIMIPPIQNTDNIESVSYAGGYVKEPKCQIYGWNVSFDLKSMYPHLQQQFNISPECLIHGESIPVQLDEISPKLLNGDIDVNPKHILAANGRYFNKDKEGFVPKILREIYDERSTIKKQMLLEKQKLVDLEVAMIKLGFLEK